jgi:hypothetical protein
MIRAVTHRSTVAPASSPRARLGLALVTAALFWWFWDSPLLLPAKLLAVVSHETGHAVATLLAGGKVTGISIEASEGGSCLSLLPDSVFARILVSSSGYVGSTFFASVLLWLAVRFRFQRAMLFFVSLWLATVALLYADGVFTLSFCLVMSITFAVLARFVSREIASGLNIALASLFALYALVDLKLDLWDSQVRAQSDAAILAQSTHIPSVVWAFVWTLLSAGILLVAASKLLKASSPLPRAKSDKR